jgi:hypothetical protein
MNPVNVSSLIALAYKLQEKTPDTFAPAIAPFQPITKGHYPIFNHFPRVHCQLPKEASRKDSPRRDGIRPQKVRP